MNVAVSSLAWEASDDDEVGRLLADAGVGGVEIAPTKRFPRPLEAEADDVVAYRKEWEGRGLPIVALQSLLFGQPDLTLFATAEARQRLAAYLAGIIDLGAALGASVLVLGSPKNRHRNGLADDEAALVAREFFAAVGERAATRGLCLCIEPNPPEYDCDFVTTVAEGRALAETVGSAGFGLHIDAGAMAINGEDPAIEIERSLPVLRHFHISDPFLVPAGSSGRVAHDEDARALRDVGYQGWVSVEMLPPPGPDPMATLRQVAAFAVETYGDSRR